ncbi:hypothetical protein [Coleofasciculus sp. FACHB-SPT36]|uniref:hypothetical protein n=1 Tax=Cyanophyceae TaxID=3028117 RepID=UPI00168BE771|nr:hypothetical protein [Coleofasciculus sp. FACHB-SPT36]
MYWAILFATSRYIQHPSCKAATLQLAYAAMIWLLSPNLFFKGENCVKAYYLRGGGGYPITTLRSLWRIGEYLHGASRKSAKSAPNQRSASLKPDAIASRK